MSRNKDFNRNSLNFVRCVSIRHFTDKWREAVNDIKNPVYTSKTVSLSLLSVARCSFFRMMVYILMVATKFRSLPFFQNIFLAPPLNIQFNT